jgi:hypothetical protein
MKQVFRKTLLAAMAATLPSVAFAKDVEVKSRVAAFSRFDLDKARHPDYFSATLRAGTLLLLDVELPFPVSGFDKDASKIVAIEESGGGDLWKRSQSVKSDNEYMESNALLFDQLGQSKDGNAFLLPLALTATPAPGTQELRVKAKIGVMRASEKAETTSVKSDEFTLNSGESFKAGGESITIGMVGTSAVDGKNKMLVYLDTKLVIEKAVFKTANGLYGSSVKPANGKTILTISSPSDLRMQKGILLLDVKKTEIETLLIDTVAKLARDP